MPGPLLPGISKIARMFGVRPRRDLENGRAELIDWLAIARQPVDRSLSELTAGNLVV